MKALKADLSTFYTVEQVKAMDINSLVDKLEEKLGRKLDGGTLAWLAIAKGAGTVHTINLGTGKSRAESINWEGITELLNGPAKPPPPPYEGPLVEIEDPKHFAEALLFALQHSTPVYDEDLDTGKLVRRKAPDPLSSPKGYPCLPARRPIRATRSPRKPLTTHLGMRGG